MFICSSKLFFITSQTKTSKLRRYIVHVVVGKNKFSYRVGTIYEYTYETETKTGIQGATEEQGGLKVTATAEIEVLSKCELLLTVS